jgi:hypothetical protein
MLLPAGAPALSTGLSNNPALAKAMGAGSNISKATKDALLNPADPPTTITGRTPTGLASWLRAAAPAQRALLSTRYIYFFLAAEGCLFKSNGYLVMQVGTAPGAPTSSGSGTTKEVIEVLKDTAHSTKAKVFKATPEEAINASVPKTVVGRALFRVGKHFIGFVYFLKPCLSPILMVMVRVTLKSQLAKSLLYILSTGVSTDTKYLIVIPLYCHI